MKKYKLLISPAANDRMYDHFLFLAQVSEKAALTLLDKLEKDIKSLEFMPQSNPYFERPYLEERKYRYKLSYRRYRIVYQIVNGSVFVEDIQDCRQNDDKSLLADG
ncbi:MAG: type II toxin-antitoxin system RelE/ParE family toxin [Treponema sp.]|nr:type II toxin-antitoxin system RelE/ParE family toxin [Treponema sp.]